MIEEEGVKPVLIARVSPGFEDAFARYSSAVGLSAPAALKAIVQQIVTATRVEPEELEVPKQPAIRSERVTVRFLKEELAQIEPRAQLREIGRGAAIGTMANIQGGLPDGLSAVRDRFGDSVKLIVHDIRDPDRRRQLIGWDNLPVLRSGEPVSKSSNVLSPSSIERVAKDTPRPTSSVKPSATPQTIEEWGESLQPKMEELGCNETLRREIARKRS